MGGLVGAVGDGISSLFGGAISAILAAIGGMVAAVNAALPAGALPVIGVALLLLVAWRVLRS